MSIIARSLMMAATQAGGPVKTVFVSTGSSLTAIDVTDATSPTKISALSADLNAGRLVFSSKRNHVYATTRGDNEIISIDVSDASAMSISQTLSIAGEAGALALDDRNDVLYWYRMDNGYVYSYDVSDPTNLSQLDVLVGVGLSSSVSAGMALDLKSKRLLVSAGSIVTNGFHRINLIDVSDPSNMIELDEVSRSIDEVNGNYSKVALDVENKIVYWSSERYTTRNSYSGDVIGSNISTLDNGASSGQSYFRGRDNAFFDGEGSSSTIVPDNLRSFDDYRLLGFYMKDAATDEFVCSSLSDPTSPSDLGSIADAAFVFTNEAVAATSGPSATKAYGR